MVGFEEFDKMLAFARRWWPTATKCTHTTARYHNTLILVAGSTSPCRYLIIITIKLNSKSRKLKRTFFHQYIYAFERYCKSGINREWFGISELHQ